MTTIAARVEQRAWMLIREAVARLDKDIADTEKRLEKLRARHDALLLIRDAELGDVTGDQAAALGRALILYGNHTTAAGTDRSEE